VEEPCRSLESAVQRVDDGFASGSLIVHAAAVSAPMGVRLDEPGHILDTNMRLVSDVLSCAREFAVPRPPRHHVPAHEDSHAGILGYDNATKRRHAHESGGGPFRQA
jgi:hypothetical protein